MYASASYEQVTVVHTSGTLKSIYAGKALLIAIVSAISGSGAIISIGTLVTLPTPLTVTTTQNPGVDNLVNRFGSVLTALNSYNATFYYRILKI